METVLTEFKEGAGPVMAKIRRVLPEEESYYKYAKKTIDWVQLCPFCNEWVGSLVDHVKYVHTDRNSRMIKTQCPYEKCAKVLVDIKNHIRFVHNNVRNFKCGYCNSAFLTNSQLIQHVQGVHDNVKSECAECGGVFKSTTLKRHIRRVHKGFKSAIPCPESGCEKVFSAKADLDRHVLGVHKKWRAPCPECGKKFRMESLTMHMKRTHRGIHNIKCEKCGQGFQNQKLLLTHTRVTHRGVYIYCKALGTDGKECGKVLVSEESLIKHVKCKHMRVSTSNVKISCPNCSTYIPACYMLHHISSAHAQSNITQCVVKGCDVKLKTKSELNNHVDTVHQSLGLDSCQRCEQFVLNLAQHLKLQHEVDLPFQPVYGVFTGLVCRGNGCNFMASGETVLAKHVRREHGKKFSLVKCDVCEERIINLEKHVKTNHIKECVVALIKIKPEVVTDNELLGRGEVKLPWNSRFMNYSESYRNVNVKNNNAKNIPKMFQARGREHHCPECEKYFKTNTHLKTHIAKVHIGLRDECPKCKKLVKNVKQHNDIVHSKAGCFSCNICTTKYATRSELKNHKKSEHIMNNLNSTKSEAILNSSQLGQHQKFCCTHCGKLFKSRGQLADHVMRVHMGVREECNICGLLTKDLKRHNMYTNCGRRGYVPRKSK